mmetsp:Transcript_30132/g.54970  ORF Transcript_30132/g.54970 Transcript_30132/m.54970 type:complete len:425 (-) Transcript_30132:52-1326(-)
MAARRRGRPNDATDAATTDKGRPFAAGDTTSIAQEDFPPLSPPVGVLDAWQLWFDRLGRVGLASVVPLLCIFAVLPRTLFLVRAGELCLRRGLYHPRGLVFPCSGDEEPSLLQQLQVEWRSFAFAAWVSVQFVYNFAEACYRDPGIAKPIAEGEVKSACVAILPDASACYAPRWCGRCKSWKAPRVHHSSRLGRCVIRMDHYCSTVENVVGGRNHGHFVLMVIFAVMGLLYGLGFVLRAVLAVWTPYWKVYERRIAMTTRLKSDSIFERLTNPVQVFNLVLGMDLLFFLVIAGIAIYLLCPLVQNVATASTGSTVLETLLPARSRDQVLLMSGKTLPLPLDAFSEGSRWANLRALLGPKWYLRCLLPVRGSQGLAEEVVPRLRNELLESILDAVRADLANCEGEVEDEVKEEQCVQAMEPSTAL